VKLVFLGTPDFALPSLEALAGSNHEVALVVTQPDRPKGRGKKLVAPPVKLRAQKLGLKVRQPLKLSTPEGIELIESVQPDAVVVCAYGEILSRKVLALSSHGFFNVHASLLPKFRGAAPVHHAILSGESVSGVTIIKVVEQVDAGEIVLKLETEIKPDDTAGSLTERLSRLGAGALLSALERIESGTAVFEQQDESKATYAPKITKEDARIDWNREAVYLERFVRAMSTAPGAYTFIQHGGRNMRLIIAVAKAAEGCGNPGEVLAAPEGHLVVATRQGKESPGTPRALELAELKPEGKKTMSAAEFLRGYDLLPEDILE
jgi:methionyl-tRNA formyltransferase